VEDIIEDGVTGWLIPYTDMNMLTDVILKIVQHPQYLHQLGMAARRKVEQEHSIKSEIEKMVEELRV
jgi:glycosyltransferase involved in cell wall biosynthesis